MTWWTAGGRCRTIRDVRRESGGAPEGPRAIWSPAAGRGDGACLRPATYGPGVREEAEDPHRRHRRGGVTPRRQRRRAGARSAPVPGVPRGRQLEGMPIPEEECPALGGEPGVTGQHRVLIGRSGTPSAPRRRRRGCRPRSWRSRPAQLPRRRQRPPPKGPRRGGSEASPARRAGRCPGTCPPGTPSKPGAAEGGKVPLRNVAKALSRKHLTGDRDSMGGRDVGPQVRDCALESVRASQSSRPSGRGKSGSRGPGPPGTPSTHAWPREPGCPPGTPALPGRSAAAAHARVRIDPERRSSSPRFHPVTRLGSRKSSPSGRSRVAGFALHAGSGRLARAAFDPRTLPS
jgi:hypothetical protein